MKPHRLGSVVRDACAVAVLAFIPFMTAAPASAQTSVTASDIQRLQDQVYDTSNDISRLRSTSPDTAARLQTELDDVRDEVVYLKVKLRKEGSLGRNEYADVRDRLQSLQSRARGDGHDAGQWRTNSDTSGSSSS